MNNSKSVVLNLYQAKGICFVFIKKYLHPVKIHQVKQQRHVFRK